MAKAQRRAKSARKQRQGQRKSRRKLLAIIAAGITLTVVVATIAYRATQTIFRPNWAWPIVMIQAESSPFNHLEAVELVDSLLTVLQEDRLMGAPARALLPSLPAIGSIIRDGFSAAGGDLQIDIVNMVHPVPDTPMLDAAPEAIVAEVQERIRDLLQWNSYQVIGFEGSTLPRVTVDNLLREIVENNESVLGRQLTPEEVRLVLTPYLEDGVIMYLKQQPEAMVVGLEEYSLLLNATRIHFAYRQALTRRELFSREQILDYQWIDQLIVHLRSEVALAKIILGMHRESARYGAIIFGQAHGEYMATLAGQLGIRSHVYQLVPPQWQGR